MLSEIKETWVKRFDDILVQTVKQSVDWHCGAAMNYAHKLIRKAIDEQRHNLVALRSDRPQSLVSQREHREREGTVQFNQPMDSANGTCPIRLHLAGARALRVKPRREREPRHCCGVGYLIVAPSTAVLVPPPCWVKRGRTANFCGLCEKRLSVLR